MLNLDPVNQKLPAGLEDKGVEFYVSPITNDVKCLHAGKTFFWKEVPSWIIDIVEIDMMSHPEAVKALIDWNIHRSDDRLKQYVFCRFGGFDNEPDIDAEGKINYTEYFECGMRGMCKYEGKICATIKVGEIDGEVQHLTKRELEVLKLVAQGLLNKEIADRLTLSEHTIDTHIQNIQRKGTFQRKSDMSYFAAQKNLI